MARFYDTTSGPIKIDNQNIKLYTKKSIRHQIRIVHQNSFLFTISLHDNIAFGKYEADRIDIINAAKAAQIHDCIETLEQGNDKIVGEREVTLSRGQRQHVAIARGT